MNLDLQALADDNRMRKLNSHLPGLLTAALVIVSAWLAAGLAWQLVETATTEPGLPAAEAVPGSDTSDPERIDVQRIADLHLFGKAEASGEEIAPENIDAPETRLNLQLQGILAADGDGEGLAIIRSGSKEKVYGPGDSVAGGARVHSVLADRVILRRGGQLETLRLPKLGEDVDGIEISATPDRPPAPSDDFGQLRQEISKDPSRLTELVNPKMVMRDGNLYGYRLYPGRDRSAFTRAGLMPGDIVTAINGTPLNDPAQAMGLMNSLQDAGSITLTVERGGETMSVSLNASQ